MGGILVVLSQNSQQWRALQKAVINILITLNAGEILTSWITVSFSIRNFFHGLIISFIFVTLFEKFVKPIF